MSKNKLEPMTKKQFDEHVAGLLRSTKNRADATSVALAEESYVSLINEIEGYDSQLASLLREFDSTQLENLNKISRYLAARIEN